jgi:hypothetical protein
MTDQTKSIPELVSKGDMALILKADGTISTMCFDVDTAAEMTEEDLAVLERGQKLMALTVAAQSPQLMAILLDVATDPGILPEDTLKKFLRPN